MKRGLRFGRGVHRVGFYKSAVGSFISIVVMLNLLSLAPAFIEPIAPWVVLLVLVVYFRAWLNRKRKR